MIDIIRLSRSDAIYYFSAVCPFILKGLERSAGEYSLKDYEENIEDGYWDLWLAIVDDKITAVAVTEIVRYPKYNELLVKLVAGEDHKVWATPDLQQAHFITWAKQNNCKQISQYGRKGWIKVLSKLGWNESYTKMTKEI